MKLLFFTSKPIYPSVDGGCFASEKFLSCLLHAEIDVQYITLSTNKHPFDLNQFPVDLVNNVNPINYFVNTDIKPFAALKSLFNSRSFNADRFFSTEIESQIKQLITTNNFDGIVFDSLYTLPYLNGIRSVFSGKMAVRTHNVEHQLWEQYAKDSSGLKKWYLKRLARDLKKFELAKLSEIDEILSISTDDSKEFNRLGISTKITDVRVPVRMNDNPSPSQAQRIYHLGMMDWEPNRQAVNTLVSWMPELRNRMPNLELHIAGSHSKECIQADEQNGIFVHGFVESVDVFVRTHGMLVSPIKAASGVRIKFLEAMAQGVSIITTSVGALGIDYENCNCMRIAETKSDFLAEIETLISNPSKQEEIGRNAMNYIHKNHNIDAISQTIFEVFEPNT